MNLARKWTLFLAILIGFSLLFNGKPAFAKNSISVDVKAGIDGNLKSERGFPVYITIKNDGEDFSGEMIITFAPSYNAGGGKAVHVVLPAGTTKEYTVSVPGINQDMGYEFTKKPIIHLFKGDWKHGNEIKVSGKLSYTPRFIPSVARTTGILSENPDRLKALKTIPNSSGPMETFSLSKDSIPTESLGLDIFDYIIVDEYAITQLDEHQQDALLNWIENGGVLIGGATPNGLQSFGKLQEFMPMDTSKEKKLHDLSFLNVHKEKTPLKELQVFTGEVSDHAIVHTSVESLPIVVKKEVGNGAILQTAFSLGDEPLSTWSGYSQWLGELLSNVANPNPKELLNNGSGFYDSLYYEFAETNEMFPSSQFSIGIIISILLCYFVLIVPILYIILKKLDKREHSWWVIPAFSVIVTTGIFFTGAKDRIASPQLNEMGAFAANGNGQLYGTYAATLMSNTSGDYTFSFRNGEFQGVPVTRDAAMNAGQTYKQAVVENKLNKQQVTFNNVEYWSTRSLTGFANKQNAGNFVVDLAMENQTLIGEIVNQFPYDFTEMYIWSGNNTYKLGALKKGEALKISEKLQDPFLSTPIYIDNMNQGYNPNMQSSDISKRKMDRLKWMTSRLSESHTNNEPIVYGITENPVIDSKLEKKKAKTRSLSFIYQPFKIEGSVKGPFTLSNSSFNINVKVIQGNIFEDRSDSRKTLDLDNGEYELTFQLPQQMNTDKTVVQEIQALIEPNESVEYSIYDFSSKKYIQINKGQGKLFLFDKNPQRFFENGEFKVRLIKSGQGDPHIIFPTFTLKGEVRRP